VAVTDLEARLGTRYTAETLAAVARRYPGARFVWLMGADNLRGFHRWEKWDEIMQRVPVGVLARRFARWRLPQSQAGALADMAPPCWTLLTGRMLDLSSSGLRARGAWNRAPNPS
jgi:nicotinate-nucleotide adenylyltransferase